MMANANQFSPWRVIRYIVLIFAAIAFFAAFLIWRTDNPRIESIRFALMDRLPSIDWVYTPVRSVGGIVTNFKSYDQLTRENRELRQQLQQMESWREAALQLEQINAELRALNNLSIRPNMNFVTGEVIADSGSPFSQTALVNIGRNKGVQVGAPAEDGVGVIGRVIGVGEDKSRILLLSDPSSQVSAHIMPEGVRALVVGNSSRYLTLKTIEGGSTTLEGSRVVTSGDGIYPEGLLIGYVVSNENNTAVRIAANLSSLELARILLPSGVPDVPLSDEFIGSISPDATEATDEEGANEGENGEASEAAEDLPEAEQ